MTLAPGTRLGPYEVLGQLGAGGMGEVWLARDTRLEREVALKVLPAQLSDTKSFTGVNKARFAYYIKWNGNTYYSHDGFNSDGMVHALTFAGNGQNTGCWWQCWEESEITDYAQADFDDAVVFMESLNPTPVSHMTWGRVKARFR